MSCTMVPIGPLAFAGSNPNFRRENGIKSPVTKDDKTALKTAIPRISGRTP